MSDKDKIIEGLIKSKVEIIADRNERSAMIRKELSNLGSEIKKTITQLQKSIQEMKE